MSLFGALRERFASVPFDRPVDEKTSIAKAIQWIKNHRLPGGGILTHHKSKDDTAEVTGYIITTLHNFGEKQLAIDLARWEASVQRPDGGVVAPGTAVPYTFDTAQVIRGFVTVLDDLPEIEKNLRSACDYVDNHIDAKGKIHTESYDFWALPGGGALHDYGNLYVLPPMLHAGKKLGEPKYIAAAKRGMDHYRSHPDLVNFRPELSMLSHYFGYMMEALVELGEFELAKKGLRQALAIQKKDGSIPAYPGAAWVCSTGMAQLAIPWYMLGEREPADRAMDYLFRLQNPSGGFYGGYGREAQYFPQEEISWAVKYFIDAYLWKTNRLTAS